MEILKGNLAVAQSGGPTSAINATLAGVIKAAQESPYIDKIYGGVHGINGIIADNIIDLGALVKTDADYMHLCTTPSSALLSCRHKLKKPAEDPETYEKILDFFKRHDIRYFFYIGGNDSMDTAAKLSEYMKDKDYAIRIMGVPKTIDNDLYGTDHTPGFGSAAKYVAVTMQEILLDACVYDKSMVVIAEIMGRDAGWLTAAASLAGCDGSGKKVDFIYLPEVPFDMDAFDRDLKAKLAEQTCVVIAISEGARLADGTYLGADNKKGAVDSFGHAVLTGVGAYLADHVRNTVDTKVRAVEFGLMQRCGAHIASKTDIDESFEIGQLSVKTAIDGGVGKMICVERESGSPYRVKFVAKDVCDIANKVRNVPRDFINAEGNNVTKECIDYLMPLISGESYPEYKNGLAVHTVFNIK